MCCLFFLSGGGKVAIRDWGISANPAPRGFIKTGSLYRALVLRKFSQFYPFTKKINKVKI